MLDDPGIAINAPFVLNGGSLSGAHSVIGQTSATTATVTGALAKWTNQGRLTIGSGGEAQLSIINGGEVSSAESIIGDASNNAFGKVDVSGSSSSWKAGALAVGRQSGGTLNISAGSVIASNLEIGGGGAFQSGLNGTGVVNVNGGSTQPTNLGVLGACFGASKWRAAKNAASR